VKSETAKSNKTIITLLGNNSGRNLGDAAILSSILEHLSQDIPNSKFYVPAIYTEWIKKDYSKSYDVEAINVMPWTGSIRLLGIPTLRCIMKSDMVLICDGIIFGKKILNPVFNYLITLVFLVPFAKLFGAKVICFNCGIGPFPSKFSQWCAKFVMNLSDLITLRDHADETIARNLGVTKEIILAGDSAFINPVESKIRAKEIALKEGFNFEQPLMSVNITSYLDSWLPKDMRLSSPDTFIEMLAEGISAASKTCGFQPIIVSTQPMDDVVSNKLAKLLEAKTVTNSNYNSHEIMSVMRECALHIGMRVHSCILAAAVGVPIIGLIYAPKVRGLLNLIETPEFGLELNSLDAAKVEAKITEAWNTKESLKNKQQNIVEKLKVGAKKSGSILREKFLKNTDKQSARQSAKTA